LVIIAKTRKKIKPFIHRADTGLSFLKKIFIFIYSITNFIDTENDKKIP
jgi:hypothetical protein